MANFKIFIVEDDPWYGELLEYHLSLNSDYQITRFTCGKEVLNQLHLKPDLITVDFSLPDYKGDELYTKIKTINNQIPVVIISAQEEINIAVKLLKMGVYDYIIKDENTKDVLWNTIIKIRENSHLKQKVDELKTELGHKYSIENSIKGQSDEIKKTFLLIEKATKTNINVSITGETGTGKELVAKAIHYNSEKSKQPFVAVNMSAIPKELIESELFGYEKGAFTGANNRKIGKFEEANGGTIFLDEIAELELNLQSKILRVIQEREVTRLGGNTSIKLEFRLIVATHKNLAVETQKGLFREDLYYRILGLPISLPPLRDRGNDILILAKCFVDEFCKDNNLEQIIISNKAKDKLMSYHYPGNVRELKAIMELAAVLCNNNEINSDDISFNSPKQDEFYIAENKTMREYTCDIIKIFLKKHNNDIMVVAKKLDIGKSTIYKMIQDKEIEV